MTDLIKRLEAATGGSWTLDYEIARELQWRFSEKEEFKEFGSFWWDAMTDEWRQLPWWTTSIDAALTLVPEGWLMQLSGQATEDGWGCRLTHMNKGEAMRLASSPALALCLAALKARELDTK